MFLNHGSLLAAFGHSLLLRGRIRRGSRTGYEPMRISLKGLQREEEKSSFSGQAGRRRRKRPELQHVRGPLYTDPEKGACTVDYNKEIALKLLKSEGKTLERLYQEADEVSRTVMGEDIYIRGIVEF